MLGATPLRFTALLPLLMPRCYARMKFYAITCYAIEFRLIAAMLIGAALRFDASYAASALDAHVISVICYHCCAAHYVKRYTLYMMRAMAAIWRWRSGAPYSAGARCHAVASVYAD